jgi:hypothetical protein
LYLNPHSILIYFPRLHASRLIQTAASEQKSCCFLKRNELFGVLRIQ